MTDVTTLLAGIKARAEKATEGPWVTYHENGVPGQLEAFNCPPATGAFLIEYADRDQQQRDANFMAHARTDVPRLVAAIEAVEEQAWACDELADITPNETAAEALRLAARGIRAAVVGALGEGAGQ